MSVRLLRRLTDTALRAAFRSRSAVDVRKAPSSPNGHGPPGRPLDRRQRGRGSPSPQAPPSLPQRAFTRGRVRNTRQTHSPKTRGVRTAFIKFLLTPLTDTTCGRLSVAAGAGGPAFSQRSEKRRSRHPSPKPPIPSPARSYRGNEHAAKYAMRLKNCAP